MIDNRKQQYEFVGIENRVRSRNKELFFKYLDDFVALERSIPESEIVPEQCNDMCDDQLGGYGFESNSGCLMTHDKDLFYRAIYDFLAYEENSKADETNTDEDDDEQTGYGFAGKKYHFSTSNKSYFFEVIYEILDEEKSLSDFTAEHKIKYEFEIGKTRFNTVNSDLFLRFAKAEAIKYALSERPPEVIDKLKNQKDEWVWDRPWRDSNPERWQEINISFEDESKEPEDRLYANAQFRRNKDGDRIDFERYVKTPRQDKEDRIFHRGGEWGDPPPTSEEDLTLQEFCDRAEELIADMMGDNKLDKKYQDEELKRLW